MSSPYRYTSVCEIIDRVQTNLDWQNEPVRKSDMVDWIGQAIKKIGAYPMFKSRVTGLNDGSYPTPVLQINDYRCEIPCDCYKIVQVAVGSSAVGPFNACREATGSFDIIRGDLSSQTTIIPSSNTYPTSMDDKIQFVADVFGESYSDAFTRLNTDANLNTILDNVFLNSNFITDNATYPDADFTYVKNPPYLEFSVRTGYCMMAYKAIATDKDGYPLIPDEEDLKEAIWWYINMRLSYPLWRNGKLKDMVYMDAVHNWGKFSKKAYGNFMMPSDDEMVTVFNIWNRMLPIFNQDQSFFKYIGEQEKLYNS